MSTTQPNFVSKMLFVSQTSEEKRFLVGDIKAHPGLRFRATLNFDVPPPHQGRAFIRLGISSTERSETGQETGHQRWYINLQSKGNTEKILHNFSGRLDDLETFEGNLLKKIPWDRGLAWYYHNSNLGLIHFDFVPEDTDHYFTPYLNQYSTPYTNVVLAHLQHIQTRDFFHAMFNELSSESFSVYIFTALPMPYKKDLLGCIAKLDSAWQRELALQLVPTAEEKAVLVTTDLRNKARRQEIKLGLTRMPKVGRTYRTDGWRKKVTDPEDYEKLVSYLLPLRPGDWFSGTYG